MKDVLANNSCTKKYRFIVSSSLSVLLLSSVLITGCSDSDDKPPPPLVEQTKIERLVSQMTLDEKISFLHGSVKGLDMSDFGDPEMKANVGYIPGIERLNIAPLRLSDGPVGVRYTKGLTTAMPAPVSLASSFDPELSYRYGEAIGTEADAVEQDILLAPMINIVRVPGAGRNFETYGEDPKLTTIMAVEQIKGIQSKNVMADAKHFAGNNQETDRMGVNTVIDERTLHEIYLPAFEAAVDAKVATFMCSYNKIAIDGTNSEFTCASKELLNDILRTKWKYDGFVMTDWYAITFQSWASGAATMEPYPILNGLDMEMPSYVLLGDSLRDKASRNDDTGKQFTAAIDTSVSRILTQMDRFNLLNGKRKPATTLAQVRDKHHQLAKEVAIEGAVLLHNDNNFLPLDAEVGVINSVLVVGHTAVAPNYGGGGSSRVKPAYLHAPLDIIKAKLGASRVTYLAGVSLDGAVIPNNNLFNNGVTGLMRNDDTIDSIIDFMMVNGTGLVPSGIPLNSNGEIVWTGEVLLPDVGKYELLIQVKNGTASLTVDGKKVGVGGMSLASSSLITTSDGLMWGHLVVTNNTVNQTYAIEVAVSPGKANDFSSDLSDPTKPTSLRLAWITPNMREDDIKAVEAEAVKHTNVILFAGNEYGESGDAFDIKLVNGQNELIARTLATQVPTVVVLNVGAPIEMPWMDGTDKPKALLNMWLPGQAGAEATTDILFGDAAPGGRLPVTFPKKLTDYVLVNDLESFPGVNKQIEYKEGIFVGYRWYDKENVEPRFPFGFGLSYSTFDYTNAKIVARGDGYRVSFVVKNTGTQTAVDIPQIYLGPASSVTLPMAKKALVGFEKVKLASGETKLVEVDISKRDLSYWDISTHDWAMAKGNREVYLGSSSASVTLIDTINVN